MVVRKTIDLSKPIELTPEQEKMLEALKDRIPEPDEDCPELTDEQLEQMRKILEERRASRTKEVVTIRLKPQTIKKAKSLGKGYTTLMSDILETVFSNDELLKTFI